jgi:hypothetical protein
MGSGGYLCKYLDKEYQKAVPEDFLFPGRFWGCSRNLVPHPQLFDKTEFPTETRIDFETGEITEVPVVWNSIVRIFRKYLASNLRRYQNPMAKMISAKSRTIANGTVLFRQMIHGYSLQLAPF